MNGKKEEPTSNVVNLNDARMHKKSSVMTLLADSRRVARAICSHVCLICRQKKMCVNKTGVCASCYDTALTAEEKTFADKEAKHKIIKITVVDDRWEQ